METIYRTIEKLVDYAVFIGKILPDEKETKRRKILSKLSLDPFRRCEVMTLEYKTPDVLMEELIAECIDKGIFFCSEAQKYADFIAEILFRTKCEYNGESVCFSTDINLRPIR